MDDLMTLILGEALAMDPTMQKHFEKYNEMIDDLMQLGVDEDKAIAYVNKHLDFAPVKESLIEGGVADKAIDSVLSKLFDV